MKHRSWFIAVALVAATAASMAQQLRPLPSPVVYGELLRLRSLTSVLYVAAHPDDENTRLLAWLARGRHIRTGYVSITRGDGGQNIIGGEQGAPLGLIRTHELLKARELDGAEQFFARAIDFGFSKNPDETFRQWDKATLVADMVRIINTMRPDVVICRFPKDSMAGHGQHSASAIIAEDAMRVCMSDASSWKPRRLLFNAFQFGNRSTISEGMFKLEVGNYDPLLGMGYGELAGISRSLHKSQGAGTPQAPGVRPEYFATLIGDSPTRGLFDGVDTTWTRVGRADIGRAVDSIIASFDMTHPERSLDALLRVRRMITSVDDTFWRTQKLTEIDHIILSCAGITADATVGEPTIVSGDTIIVTTRIIARAARPVTCTEIRFPTGRIRRNITLLHDSLWSETEVRSPYEAPVTEPYWLAREPSGALFSLTSEQLLGEPVTPPSLRVGLLFAFGSDTISTSVPLSFKKLDPLKGDVIEELRVVPPVSVEPVTRVVLAPNGSASVTLRVRAYRAVADASLVLRDGDKVLATIPSIRIRANTDTLITIAAPVSRSVELTCGLVIDNVVYDRTVITMQYEHLPTLQYTQPARVRIVAEPIAITAKRIAYVVGAGEYTPEFLRTLGCTVVEISDEQLLRTDELIANYDAVLVGIRAINVRKSMKFIMPSLISYVERGGTLVMSYMTTQDMSTTLLGPYPMKLGRSRVTEEDAVVTMTTPDHPLLSTPNRITARDFDGWVQERGLYFPEADARYDAPLSMHDTGEPPHTGSLIYARYGKGHYVYCALSLFRQIPAGVPGGMRLLANMLSVGK
jgi:hypothetical protein